MKAFFVHIIHSLVSGLIQRLSFVHRQLLLLCHFNLSLIYWLDLFCLLIYRLDLVWLLINWLDLVWLGSCLIWVFGCLSFWSWVVNTASNRATEAERKEEHEWPYQTDIVRNPCKIKAESEAKDVLEQLDFSSHDLAVEDFCEFSSKRLNERIGCCHSSLPCNNSSLRFSQFVKYFSRVLSSCIIGRM